MLDLSLDVLRVAAAEGFSQEQVENMVAKAALVKHARGNRRYHQWVFKVEQGEECLGVLSMTRHQSPFKIVHNPLYPVMFEVCSECESSGCKECGWTGELEILYQPE